MWPGIPKRIAILQGSNIRMDSMPEIPKRIEISQRSSTISGIPKRVAALQEYSGRMDSMRHCLRSAKECKECTKSRVFTAMIIRTELGNGNAGVSVVASGHKKQCSSTGYVNEWDLPMNFMCPANQYIAGVESDHDNGREDRRWKFTCCGIPNHITLSC